MKEGCAVVNGADSMRWTWKVAELLTFETAEPEAGEAVLASGRPRDKHVTWLGFSVRFACFHRLSHFLPDRSIAYPMRVISG
jgi:hypothetical protein